VVRLATPPRTVGVGFKGAEDGRGGGRCAVRRVESDFRLRHAERHGQKVAQHGRKVAHRGSLSRYPATAPPRATTLPSFARSEDVRRHAEERADGAASLVE
jgi:hypothetical protein